MRTSVQRTHADISYKRGQESFRIPMNTFLRVRRTETATRRTLFSSLRSAIQRYVETYFHRRPFGIECGSDTLTPGPLALLSVQHHYMHV